MLNFHVKQAMVIDEVYEVTSFKQSKWLEKYTSFNTQKRFEAANDFRKNFYKLLNNAF